MSLYLLQKREICVVCKSNFLDHTLILFKNLCTLPLFDLIKPRTAIFIHKVYYNLLPLSLLEYFLHTILPLNKSRKFSYVTYSRTTKKQHSITYIGPRILNLLEIFIKDSTNLNLFRLRYKNKLMSSLL